MPVLWYMKKAPLIILLLLASSYLFCQDKLPFLMPADTFHAGRFWTCAATGAALYGSASFGLYQVWYKEYELGGFRTFNDWGEWNDMDKVGHLVTAYNMAHYSYNGLRWTGTRHNKSIWLAMGVGQLLQTTIEVMDGFSVKWGFSWYDVGFNTLGVGAFAAQEWAWHEQRVHFKLSNSFPSYPSLLVSGLDGTTTVRQRAADLYGTTFGEQLIKDYNGMTLWASANIAAFVPESQRPRWIPPWLNVAVGYGAENMLGGFTNEWTNDANQSFTLPNHLYPRHRQLYLSLDVDTSRIPVRRRWAKTLLSAINWIKVPAPALEYNTLGEWRVHPLYW